MFGEAYGDARMPNWPHWHRTPLPGITTTALRRDVRYLIPAILWLIWSFWHLN